MKYDVKGDTKAMENTVEFRNITKYFPGVKALDHVSFFAKSGEVLAFLGENGAGKSTLLKTLNGDYQPDEGEYLINGVAGLNPQRIVTISFVMMGMLCALGGTIFAARMNSGQPAANVNLEFDAITAVILGGVSFTGGVGNMGGTILGVVLIQAFNTGLTMVNVPSFWQYVAKGLLLLFALSSDYLRKQRREKGLLEASKKNG